MPGDDPVIIIMMQLLGTLLLIAPSRADKGLLPLNLQKVATNEGLSQEVSFL